MGQPNNIGAKSVFFIFGQRAKFSYVFGQSEIFIFFLDFNAKSLFLVKVKSLLNVLF
jgi:hypothetical protein